MSVTRRDRNIANRRDEERERIMVAAPRPTIRAPASNVPGRAAGASDAGLALIFVIAVFAIAGVQVGHTVGAPTAGALVGGFVGTVAGFTGIYMRYRNL
jgi:hypothetical protein